MAIWVCGSTGSGVYQVVACTGPPGPGLVGLHMDLWETGHRLYLDREEQTVPSEVHPDILPAVFELLPGTDPACLLVEGCLGSVHMGRSRKEIVLLHRQWKIYHYQSYHFFRIATIAISTGNFIFTLASIFF